MLYLIDASHFLFRAYHALPPLERPDGQPIGAVFGFLNMLFKLTKDKSPQHLVVVFDSPGPTFRKDIFDAYKANRPPPPPDLAFQFELVKKACAAMKLPMLEQSGVEADDLMASAAVSWTANNTNDSDNQESVLVSSDKDLMQLLSPGILMFDAMKNRWLDNDDVLKKFGVTPHLVTEVQALMGDTSDNIPGVPGVGPKTASGLIGEYGSLENLYDNIENIKRPKLKASLQEHKENAFLSRQLATLKTDCAVPSDPDFFRFCGLDTPDFRAFLAENNFQTLLSRLQTQAGTGHAETETPGSTAAQSTHSMTLPTKPLTWRFGDLDSLGRLLSWAKETGFLSLALSKSNDATFDLALWTPGADAILFFPGNEAGRMAPVIKNAAQDNLLRLICPNMSDLTVFLGEPPNPFMTEDITLALYLLDGPFKDRPNIQQAADKHHIPLPTLEDAPKNQPPQNDKTLFPSDDDKTPDHSDALGLCQEAAGAAFLFRALKRGLQDKSLFTLYQTLDKPLVPVLMDMETTGIGIDTAVLQDLGRRFSDQIETYTSQAHEIAKEEFNPASPKQLSHILFDVLGLAPPGKKGKAGHYSTKGDVLESLDHPIIPPILGFRQLSKLKNTYVDGLLAAVNPKTGRVHTTFTTTATATGRLASQEPNLQNIPIREEQGRQIRAAFVPRPGNYFLALDYSQIELRLLAHIGRVKPLVDAFKAGQDIHQKTAAEMFDVSLENVTAEQRRRAKMINFGIIYGISPFGLASRLGIPVDQARLYIETYLQNYGGVKDYTDACITTAQRKGYVETLWGRRIYTPQIQDRNPSIRGHAQRLAINAPLQGTSADLIKRAMIGAHAYLGQHVPNIKLLLQIHDELLFEGPKEALEKALPHLKHIMESVCSLDVPLPVLGSISQSW